MKTIYSLALLFVMIAIPATKSQVEDQPLVEEIVDNDDLIEGSGFGVLEAPEESTMKIDQEPIIDQTEQTTPELTVKSPQNVCPEACTCNVDGGEIYSFTVDCSDKQLSELPVVGLDEKTTILYLQNNKLTTVPKAIAILKDLKVLNLDNNSINYFEPGSISELPILTKLTLSNNRLLEFPQEFKNGIDLIHLEELDLSGNDIGSTVAAENFENFKSLKRLTLPTLEPNFIQVLCNSFNNTLDTVCMGSCEVWKRKCPYSPLKIEADFSEPVLPEILDRFGGELTLNSSTDKEIITEVPINKIEEPQEIETTTNTDENIISKSDVPLQRSATPSIATEKEIAELTAIAIAGEIPQEGATTSNTNTGGVDKSLIGIIVAAMVLVVAGITIQKNWSSIRAKCGSRPRPPQAAPHRNGHCAPEEEPLRNKDKSPV